MAEQSEPKLLGITRRKSLSESEISTQKDESDGSKNNQSPAVELDEEGKEMKLKDKIVSAFKKVFRSPKIQCGKTLGDVPCKKINKILLDVAHAYEAPDDALKYVHKRRLTRTHGEPDITPVAGIVNWDGRDDNCYGIVTSLYEKDINHGGNVGDPVADCLAVIARSNNCILILADGVNWGERSMLAARCAVYGAVTYLTREGTLDSAQTTKDVFRSILRAFESAQNVIMDEEATLTTLCIAVVVDLVEKEKWGLCVVNVGDSLAFVYNNVDGVREVTVGSHSLQETRDMRYSGGALGPADGYNPDLGNLTLSYTQLDSDDVVYLTSDGISDNFDPVVGRFSPLRRPSKQSPRLQSKSANQEVRPSSGPDQSGRELALSQKKDDNLRALNAEERQKEMLFKMRSVIENIEGPTGMEITAVGVCAKFVNFAVTNTNDRRLLLEAESLSDKELQQLSATQRQERSKRVKSKLNDTAGKLDHASIVAFKVGHLLQRPFRMVSSSSEGYDEIGKEDLDGFASYANQEQDGNHLPVPNQVHYYENRSWRMLDNVYDEATL